MSLVLQLGVNPHCKHGSCPVQLTVPSAASSSSAAIIIVKTKGYEPLLVPLLWKQQIIICNITIHHRPAQVQCEVFTTASTTKTLGIFSTKQRASCDQPLNKISLGQQRFYSDSISFEWKADQLGQKNSKNKVENYVKCTKSSHLRQSSGSKEQDTPLVGDINQAGSLAGDSSH